MNKRQSKQQKKQDRRKNYGWLLWIVTLIFIQGVYGTDLTKEEKDTMSGLYLKVELYTMNPQQIYFTKHDQIQIDLYTFEPKKYENDETLKQFSAIDGKYYLKEANGTKLLVISSDGILYIYNNLSLFQVFFKINGTEDANMIEVTITMKYLSKSNIKDYFSENKIEALKTELDAMIKPLTRGSALPKIPQSTLTETFTVDSNDNINKQLDDTFKFNVVRFFIVIIGLIIFIIVFCVQCCHDWDKPNAQLETNDPRNHYPSPTDLVIDIKDTGTIESTDTNRNTNSSVSTVTIDKLESNSTSLFTLTLTSSDISEKDQKSSNEMSITDDFTI
jgi:hypothetical protein